MPETTSCAIRSEPPLQDIAAATMLEGMAKKKKTKTTTGYWGMVRGAVIILRLGFNMMKAAKSAQQSILLDLVAYDFES